MASSYLGIPFISYWRLFDMGDILAKVLKYLVEGDIT